jgi:flagellar hook protein FlgE
MLQAMLASMSSIDAQQQAMDVIGNNLANVNTTGFKSSSVDFEDMLSQLVTEGAAPLQFGQGVMVGATPTNLTQGTLSATGQPNDLALQGNGYFVVNNGGTLAYTRDGGLTVNANGILVQTATGDPILGYTAGSTGNINTAGAVGTASTISIPLGTLNAAQATSAVVLGGNLSSSAASTTDVTMGANVFDALGGAHNVTVLFSGHSTTLPKNAPAGAASMWSWSASQGSTSLGASSGAGNQPLYFNASGQLLNPSALGNITIPASGSTGATPMTLNFSGLTQNAGTSSVSLTSQNGAPPGQLQSFDIGSDGTITGVFSNGITKTLAQVSVANFINPGGLANIGGNLLSATVGSGPSTIGVAGTGGRGTIQAGFLEQSNVDIGTQFTNLIVTQRGYEANTKVVTAVDQMLQDVVNIIQ